MYTLYQGLRARIIVAAKKYHVFTECTQVIAAGQTVIIKNANAATENLVKITSPKSILLTLFSNQLSILHLLFLFV